MADPLYPKRMLSQVREIRIADAPHDKHVSLRVGDCANMYIHSCIQTYILGTYVHIRMHKIWLPANLQRRLNKMHVEGFDGRYALFAAGAITDP